MSSLVGNISGAITHPARRRFWLTVSSGSLIAVGLIARYGFGMIDLWWALMVTAALLAGSDIAVRAWRALKVRHLSIELLVTVAAVGALLNYKATTFPVEQLHRGASFIQKYIHIPISRIQ